MSNFYLVCGISGGGKTHLTKHLYEINPKLKVYDVDNYYALINGDECIRENTFEVWMTLWRDLHNSEICGEDVLLTTNALTVSQRNQFIEWFPTFTHHIIWVTSPKARCYIGNNKRKRHVPSDVLAQQWKNMEFPNATEKGWETITQITNCWAALDSHYIIFKLKGNIEKYIKVRGFVL